MYVRTSIDRQSPGLGATPLPHVTAVRFRTGTADPENCCAACNRLPATAGRVNLGVGLRGPGHVPLRAANGMEWAFAISGHRRGIEYDFLRRARHSLWERVGGLWRNLENELRDDDTTEVDECQRLSRSNRIFVIDRPGWRDAAVPAAAAHRFHGLSHTPPIRSAPIRPRPSWFCELVSPNGCRQEAKLRGFPGLIWNCHRCRMERDGRITLGTALPGRSAILLAILPVIGCWDHAAQFDGDR